MESFSVRELKKTDAEALLAFETHNREWFESHIDARDPAFY
ncbi:MAG: GNAT family N-acetyltransferase, partial [Pseudomonas sp.]